MLFRLCPIRTGTALLLDKPVILLGRHSDCDGRFSSRKVSRRHCCIAQLDQGLVVRDLGSLNGTRLNGAVVKEALIREGDELAIANIRFRLEQVPIQVDRPATPPPTSVPEANAAPPAQAGNPPRDPSIELVPVSDDMINLAAQPKPKRS